MMMIVSEMMTAQQKWKGRVEVVGGRLKGNVVSFLPL